MTEEQKFEVAHTVAYAATYLVFMGLTLLGAWKTIEIAVWVIKHL